MIKDLPSDETPVNPTRDDLRHFLASGWGTVGMRVFDAWAEYNARFFDDQLAACIIALTPVSPHGRWVGCTYYDCGGGPAHLIYLCTSGKLNRGRGVLLHEMTHAWLVQQGQNAKHVGLPWCEEITRISALLGRPDVVAKPERSVRRDGSVRKQVPPGSITREAASRWPHSVGIDLGPY